MLSQLVFGLRCWKCRQLVAVLDNSLFLCLEGLAGQRIDSCTVRVRTGTHYHASGFQTRDVSHTGNLLCCVNKENGGVYGDLAHRRSAECCVSMVVGARHSGAFQKPTSYQDDLVWYVGLLDSSSWPWRSATAIPLPGLSFSVVNECALFGGWLSS